MKSQRRKFPFRAFVLRDGVIGPGKHRPHGSSQPGLSLRARCAAAPRFAPLPPSYASMVSRLVRHVGVAQPGEAPPATCEEAALVVIEPPDLWNMWWLITEALTEYALLTAVLPAVLPRGMPVRVARVVDDKRKNAAGHSFFPRALRLRRHRPQLGTRTACARRLLSPASAATSREPMAAAKCPAPHQRLLCAHHARFCA